MRDNKQKMKNKERIRLIIGIIIVIVGIILLGWVFLKGTIFDSSIDDKGQLSKIKSANVKNINKDLDYKYEVCDNGECKYTVIDKIIEPSEETFYVCNKEGSCENVPINRLLLKHGTDKEYCANAPYLDSSYVDNWWNANGLIDECKMPPKADMQFAFKQHNGSLSSHTGAIQITLTPINYEDNYLALQIMIGEDNNKDNLPDGWIFCGNVDSIRGKDKKIINCKGTNIKFVKLINPEWNPSSLYFDYILIMKYDDSEKETIEEKIIEDKTEDNLVLKNFGFDIEPWDKNTNLAGDLIFTKDILFEDQNVKSEWVFIEFGAQGQRKNDPLGNIEFWFFVPVGTDVIAPIDGTVHVAFFEHTQDWGIDFKTKDNSQWIVSFEHVVDVQVKNGDFVKAGDIVAKAAPRNTYNNKIAMVELAVWIGEQNIIKYCPFDFLDDSLKPIYEEKLKRLAKDWEEFLGKNVYEEEKWVSPGCLKDKILEK